MRYEVLIHSLREWFSADGLSAQEILLEAQELFSSSSVVKGVTFARIIRAHSSTEEECARRFLRLSDLTSWEQDIVYMYV